MHGFTTVRDADGMSGKGVKKLVDGGVVPGPRVYPSSALQSQTSGHADVQLLGMGNLGLIGMNGSNMERLDIAHVVDGRDAVVAATRRNLKLGATQIKIMSGGGVATEYDPWHFSGYTLDEIKAAVKAAGIDSAALEPGVISIEHGFAIDAVLPNHAPADQQRAHEIWFFVHHFGNHAFQKAATSAAGTLLQKTGGLNPYPLGPVGVIEQGAYADILLVDGDPLEDASVLGAIDLWYDTPPRDGVQGIDLIMKDGIVYKNTLN